MLVADWWGKATDRAAERHHGRTHLLTQLLGAPSTSDTRRRKKPVSTLALGYEVLQVRDEGDEEAVPPMSVFFPPGSGRGGVKLVQAALPPSSIPVSPFVNISEHMTLAKAFVQKRS
jgi:dynein light intermediate chain 1